jgi:hypothetical protein
MKAFLNLNALFADTKAESYAPATRQYYFRYGR